MNLKIKKINLDNIYANIYILLTLGYIFIFQFLKLGSFFLAILLISNIGIILLALIKKKTIYYIGNNNIFLIFIIIYLFFSVIFSADINSSVRFFINYLFCFIFFIVYINTSNENKNNLLIKSMYSISVIYSYISLIQYILGKNAIILYSTYIKPEYVNAIHTWTYSNRITGIGIHPGINGFIIVFGLYICLSNLKNRNNLNKILDIINIIIMIIAILLTQKRNTLVSFVIISFILSMYKSNIIKKLKNTYKYIILIIFIFITISILDINLGTIERLFNKNGQQAIYLRFILYNLAFKLFEQNFLFGTGINTFVYFTYLYNMPEKTHTHNMVLQLLAEVGIIGTVLIYSYFIINMIKNMKIYKFKDVDRGINLKICMFGQLLFLFNSITGNPLYEVRQLFIYFVSISILYSLSYERYIKGEKNDD